MSQGVTQPTNPSRRRCCCTSRPCAILSCSPSQCQKRDLQNILGCISCADSDLMSPVRRIYTSEEFQPRGLGFLLHNSPPCFLKSPWSSAHPPWVLSFSPLRIMIGDRLGTLTLRPMPSPPCARLPSPCRFPCRHPCPSYRAGLRLSPRLSPRSPLI